MLKRIRHLSLEIGPTCNLSGIHDWCPAHRRKPLGEPMPTEVIIEAIKKALSLGFEGFVGFHYYNEPTLSPERIRAVMQAVPEARYMLWTNGTNPIPEGFAWVEKSAYGHDWQGEHDERTHNYDGPKREVTECWRPFIEIPIDYAGNMHMCCQDWDNTIRVGNIAEEGFETVVKRWKGLAETISQGSVFPVCNGCCGISAKGSWHSSLRDVGMR
jgi:hypothetical protein